jgi:hypothetical protein
MNNLILKQEKKNKKKMSLVPTGKVFSFSASPFL